jgi:adhesin transport system outer membrane protein
VIELAETYSSGVRDSLAVQVLRSQVAALDELLRKVKAIAAIDRGRQSEVVQVLARREQAEQMALYRKGLAERAMARLQAMTGSAVRLEQVMPDVGDWLPVNEADIEHVLEWHPRLLSAGQQVLAADSRTRLADKAYLPVVSLDVSLGTESSFGGLSRSAPQAQISLSGTLDMFDGGGASARARAEAGRAAAVKAERDTLYRDLLAEALSQWRQLDSRLMRLEVLDRQVSSSKKLRDAGFEQFDLGRRSLTDLISFENDYFSAKLAWVEESVDIPANKLRLLAALGRVSHVLLKLAAEGQGSAPSLAKVLWIQKGSN